MQFYLPQSDPNVGSNEVDVLWPEYGEAGEYLLQTPRMAVVPEPDEDAAQSDFFMDWFPRWDVDESQWDDEEMYNEEFTEELDGGK